MDHALTPTSDLPSDDAGTPTVDPATRGTADEAARELPALVIWHGYLLGATGSNIYTHHLVESWVRSGRDVVLACQERDPAAHPSIQEAVWLSRASSARTNVSENANTNARAGETASGDRRAGLSIRERRVIRERRAGEGRCVMVVADLGGVLPVYVIDRYEGFEVVRVPGLDANRMRTYLDAHADAMRWVIDYVAASGVGGGRVGGVLINHATPLPAALAPVLDEARIPFAVKVHGSELEYALAEDPSLVSSTAEALAAASSVLVGSGHIERRTRELVGDTAIEGRVATVPPGVDLQHFRPIDGDDPEARTLEHSSLVNALRERTAATSSAGRGEAQRLQVAALVEGARMAGVAGGEALIDGLAALHGSYAEREIEQDAAEQVASIDIDRSRLVVYVGKLIPQKGVHLLLAALSRVLAAHGDAHLVVAGFGPMRDALEALLVAMGTGNIEAIEAIAERGGSLSGEGAEELEHLRGWLAAMRDRGELNEWLEVARTHRVHERVTWLGLVDHGVLAHLWPLAEASVVPSVLAEAFGMVAAEAAACGCVPVVGNHSGLADAARVIERNGVAPIRFDTADVTHAVDELASVLVDRLSLDAAERGRQAAEARSNVAAEWGWDELAIEVAALMCGQATTSPARRE